jgi:hypothetical protein
MKKLRLPLTMLALFALGVLAACSATAKSPDVSNSIRTSLDQAGFKDVSVSQDRDKGVVTLGGHVASDNDKSQAESLAKSFAGAQVVADQIAVLPVGAENEAKAVNSDLDDGISKNLDAALLQNRMHKSVKYDVGIGPARSIQATGEGDAMSFGLYSIGFAIVIGGLIYAAYLMHMPAHWIAVGAIVLLGVGILSAVKATRQKDSAG